MGPQFTLNAFSHLLGESDISLFGTPDLVRRYRKGFPRSLDGAPFLLPTESCSLRRLLNQWFAGQRVTPRVVAEFEDNELLKEHGQSGGGLFTASSIMEPHTLKHYDVELLARIESIRLRYYAISTERRVTNPAVTAILERAHQEIFG